MNKRTFLILLALAAVVYVLNLFIDVMLVDAAQYAEMSWEMLTTKRFLQVRCLDANYLDKPPLLFWLSSASMYLFGVSNASYKLPSMLAVFLGIYSTYRFAKLYYPVNTACIAALMLATTQAVLLITNDVRTDTLLMNAVIFALWQLAEYFQNNKTSNLLWGTVGVGLAMLAKGPIGLIAVGAAFFPQVVLHKKWKQVFDWRILLGLLTIGVLLLPMSIGLYQQWGTKGLVFYYWTQSFGRITGQSEWNNNPDTFFLVHTTAWAFLPWTLFLFFGWATSVMDLVKRRFKLSANEEIISLSGFTLVLIALMLSNYQLPHYAFVVYPLGAVLAARYFVKLTQQGTPKWVWTLQIVLFTGLTAISALLQYALMGAHLLSVAALVAGYVLATAAVFKTKNLLVGSAAFIIAFNILMSAFYFPAIMKYQPVNDFGRYIKNSSTQQSYLAYHFTPDFALNFYSQTIRTDMVWERPVLRNMLTQKRKLIVITTGHGLDELKADNIQHRIILQRPNYNVARLSLPFLNPATRPQVCEQLYLVEAFL